MGGGNWERVTMDETCQNCENDATVEINWEDGRTEYYCSDHNPTYQFREAPG